MRTPQDRHVFLCLAVAALVGAFAAVGGHRASAEPVAAQGVVVGRACGAETEGRLASHARTERGSEEG